MLSNERYLLERRLRKYDGDLPVCLQRRLSADRQQPCTLRRSVLILGSKHPRSIKALVLFETDIDECAINNGGCDSICMNTPGSYSCACQPGYTLLLDGKTCSDVDECRDNTRICNGGKCSNNAGGYTCECTEGLMPSPDGSTCLGIQVNWNLLQL